MNYLFDRIRRLNLHCKQIMFIQSSIEEWSRIVDVLKRLESPSSECVVLSQRGADVRQKRLPHVGEI